MGVKSIELDYFRYMMPKEKYIPSNNGIWILDQILCDSWEKKSIEYSDVSKTGI